jgi:hypothetical protein
LQVKLELAEVLPVPGAERRPAMGAIAYLVVHPYIVVVAIRRAPAITHPRGGGWNAASGEGGARWVGYGRRVLESKHGIYEILLLLVREVSYTLATLHIWGPPL